MDGVNNSETRELLFESEDNWKLFLGDALHVLPSISANYVDATITSPPYFQLKDYGVATQLGWESNVHQYIHKLTTVLAEIFRITKETGACFLIIGDSYAKKSLQLVPQRAALAARECGWNVRNDLIWAKSDAAPGSGNDRWRFTHEHILFLTKNTHGYKFNSSEIRVPYNERTVSRWGAGQSYGGPKARAKAGTSGQRFPRGKTFQLNPEGTLPPDVLFHSTARSALDHYATFPIELVERFVLAASDPADVVFDPFAGTSTTGVAAIRHGRSFLGIELSASYHELGVRHLKEASQIEGSLAKLPTPDERTPSRLD